MAVREIKTTLAIDGEKQFKAAMDAAFRSMRVLGSEMKLNTAAFGANAKSMEGLTQKGQILAKQIEQQKAIVAALAKAVEDSAAAYGEGDKRTDGYRIQLNNATAALKKLEEEAASNQAEIENWGKKVEDADSKTSKWRDTLNSIGGTLKSGLVAGAKATGAAIGAVATAAGTAAYKLAKDVVHSFGELEQNLGGAEAVFGQYADSIKKHGEDAYRNLGVSQSEYLATANKMGALFQGAGLSQQRSLDLTAQAMQRAADMASVMGIETSAALEAVAGAAKGNYTMMDNLGVAMNETSLKAFMLSSGMAENEKAANKMWKSMSQADKAELAMKMFFEKTGQYAGNFAREAEQTISGSIGMLKASVSSFIAGLGDSNADMNALTKNMITSFQAVLTNVTPVIQNIVASLPAVVETLISNIGAMLPMLLDTVLGMFTQVLNMLVSMIPQLIPVVAEAVNTILVALVDNLPAIIQGGIQLVMSLIAGLKDAIPSLTPAIVEGIRVLIRGIVDNLPLIISMGIEIITSLISGLIQALPDIIAATPQIIAGIVSGLVSGLSSILDVGRQIVEGLWEGIKGAGQWLYNKLKGWVSDAIGWIKGFLGIASPSKKMRDLIGKPMVQGVAEGINKNAGLVDKAMSKVIPSTSSFDVALNAKSAFDTAASSDLAAPRRSSSTSEISDASLGRLVKGIKAALSEANSDVVIQLNERELGRAVRRLVPA